MIESYEVGAVFKIVDQASPALLKISEHFEKIAIKLKEVEDRLLGFGKMKLTGADEGLKKLEARLSGVAEKGTAASEALSKNFATLDKSVDESVTAVGRLTKALAEAKAESRGFGRLPGNNGGGGGGGHGGGRRGGHGHLQPKQHVGVDLGLGIGSFIGAEKLFGGVEKIIAQTSALEHWKVMMKEAGATSEQIAAASARAWEAAGQNVNTTAAESLKNIIELNKVTGNWAESMKILPLFNMAEMAIGNVKAEDAHSALTHGSTQTLNFARALEEMGVTMKGKTPEEREANIKAYADELIKTMVASRGLFDGNAAFAMTNNSGGAAQNWDMRMATVVAPILGDIMKHSKLGNADYMALRTYQGGTITSNAAEALTKNHLATLGGEDDPNADVYQDKKGFHLKPNSNFAKGMETNLWDWANRTLEKMKANGVDITDQHAINEIINAIGSNKSTTMVMRALLEPGTHKQIEKEMTQRDKVPGDATGIMQADDPWLRIDAFKKKWVDFETALGGPLIDPAMKALDTVTGGLNSLTKWANDHPEATKAVGAVLLGMAAGLTAVAAAGVVSAAALLGTGGAVTVAVATIVGTITALAALHWDSVAKGFQSICDFVTALVAKLQGFWWGGGKKGTDGDPNTDALGAIPQSYDGNGFGNLLHNASYTTGDGGTGTVAAGTGAGIVNASGGVINIYAGSGSGGGGFGGGGGGGYGGGGGTGSNQSFSNKGIEAVRQYIRSKAISLGIDPNIAERVARSEGLNSTLGAGGDHGTSDGPYQLHVGGGIGDLYERLYHRSIHDKSPQAIKDQIDFALGMARKNGWGAWHGAQHAGIGNFQGIGGKYGPEPSAHAPPPPPHKHETIVHTKVHLDGKVLARSVTKQQTAMARMPHAIGGQDDYGSWASPGTTMMPA